MHMQKLLPIILLLFIVSIADSGCLKQGKKHKWQPIEQKNVSVVHEIQWPKETLEIVAKWYTANVHMNLVHRQFLLSGFYKKEG